MADSETAQMDSRILARLTITLIVMGWTAMDLIWLEEILKELLQSRLDQMEYP
jgi:hypothetical protein